MALIAAGKMTNCDPNLPVSNFSIGIFAPDANIPIEPNAARLRSIVKTIFAETAAKEQLRIDTFFVPAESVMNSPRPTPIENNALNTALFHITML